MADILAPLVLDLQVNASDTELLRNLHYAGALNLPYCDIAPARDRTLAICGSGPSLKRSWREIPTDCDVMALNGAYKFLLGCGRVPKYFAMLDAKPSNVNFVEAPHKDTYHLLASQVHPDVFEALKDYHRAVFHLNTPTTNLVFENDVTKIGCVYTVGLTALLLAGVLGYRKFILYGYDSSFENSESHALPQPQNAGVNTLEVEVAGRKYLTTHAMAAQTMEFFPTLKAMRTQWPDIDVQVIGDGLFYDYVTTNNHPPSRERELAKYAGAYQDPTYGMTQQRRDGISKLMDEGFREYDSYLDVSTGRGETLQLAREHGFRHVRGTETVDALLNEHVVRGVLPNLDIEDKTFNVVSLIEVIEHLLPEDVEPALHELARIARDHILISAAVVPHVIGGVDLHPSARPIEEWDALFHKVWGDKVYRVGKLGSSPAWRVDL